MRAAFAFGARSTLVLLTVLNLINYVDRYLLAAVLERIRLDVHFAGVSHAQLGLLQSAFLIVYMVASPAIGLLGERIPRRHLIAFGVGLWSLATIATGLARSYHELLVARAFIGFGEASYATVAPAIISDLFRRSRRARMMSIFFLATPVGSALGFVLGGTLAEAWSWRSAFFVCGVPGLLLAALALWMADPERGGQDRAHHPPKTGAREADAHGQKGRRQLRALLRNADFIQVTAGATLLSFSVGAIAFWVPTWLQETWQLSAARANQWFGGIAVVTGVAGTFAGGFLGDAWAKHDPRAYLRVSGIGALAAAPFAAAAPLVNNLPLSLALMSASMFFVFMNTGPLNTALMNATPPRMRELAMGLNILCIHLLGDAVSPPLVGAFSESMHGHVWHPGTGLSLGIASTAIPFLLGALVLLAPQVAGAGARRGSAAA